MSKTRKVLALALALVMSCTMAACGGDSEMTDGGSTSIILLMVLTRLA